MRIACTRESYIVSQALTCMGLVTREHLARSGELTREWYCKLFSFYSLMFFEESNEITEALWLTNRVALVPAFTADH